MPLEPRIEHIFTSPSHNYVGHHGGPSGDTPAVARERVGLVPGHGIAGDRYAEREHGHRKQITFFAMETVDALSERTGTLVPPQSVRRNVFTRGIDLESLIGTTFRLQGALFEGVQHCAPCYWMNEAIGPGTEDFLRGEGSLGGLRARILEGAELRVGPADLVVESGQPA
jgi:MOSC domain-containing protein YiiM